MTDSDIIVSLHLVIPFISMSQSGCMQMGAQHTLLVVYGMLVFFMKLVSRYMHALRLYCCEYGHRAFY